jgi:hypothetical protein
MGCSLVKMADKNRWTNEERDNEDGWKRQRQEIEDDTDDRQHATSTKRTSLGAPQPKRKT